MIEKIYITLEPGACVTIIDQNKRSDDHVRYKYIYAYVGHEAQLSYIYDQHSGDDATEIIYFIFYIQEKGTAYCLPLIKGGKTTIMQADLILDGSHASCYMQGSVQLKHDQQTIIMTNQLHTKEMTTSKVQINGVIHDSARMIYHGLVSLHATAQQSDAQQYSKIIMMHEQARALSMPTLEIKTDDVCCSHGSALGELDEQELFYLCSRGLPREEAQKLMVKAFLQEPYLTISCPQLSLYLKHYFS